MERKEMLLDDRETVDSFFDLDDFKGLISYWEKKDYFDNEFPGLFTDGDIYIAVPLNGKVHLDQVEAEECFIEHHSLIHVDGRICLCSCDGMWVLFGKPEPNGSQIGAYVTHLDDGKLINIGLDVFETEDDQQTPLYGLKKFNWNPNEYMEPAAVALINEMLIEQKSTPVIPDVIDGGSVC